jgi:WD40 repeat protein
LCLPYSVGDNLLVSGGGDSTIRLWNYVEGTLLSTFVIDKKGNESPIVASLTFDHVSKSIAALLEADTTVYIYSIKDNQLLLKDSIDLGSGSTLLNLSFDSEGKLWVVGSNPVAHLLEIDATTQKYKQSNSSVISAIQSGLISEGNTKY